MIGKTLGHFHIVDSLGEGGMGEVYVALDLDLKRKVALKLLPAEFAADEERLGRFQSEAETVARLNHPNIVTVFSVAHEGDLHFLTMELVQGCTLAERIPDGGLELPRFLDLAGQLARGVAAAHEQGVIHRDLKPANVMVDDSGQVKVLDFGLAKTERLSPDSALGDEQSTAFLTQEGRVLGTPAFMAPEQAAGRPIDARTDVFALGAIFFRMLTGEHPFQGDSAAELHAAVLTSRPRALRGLRAEVPPGLSDLVERCLAKEAAERPPSAVEVARELEELARLHSEDDGLLATRVSKKLFAGVVVGAVLLVAWAGWLLQRGRAEERVRARVLPEIGRLLEERRNVEAFTLVREARQVLPEDPLLADLLERTTTSLGITSDPTGAQVSFQDYQAGGSEWISLGETPIEQAELPAVTFLRFRIAKEGYDTLEVGAGALSRDLAFELKPLDDKPAGMKWVPSGFTVLGLGSPREVAGFWLDELEVTNQQFGRFIEAGGYAKRELWPDRFELEGQPLGFANAIARMVDATGRPGPATWRLGGYPEGKAKYPVAGVSWYEAGAYCSSVGKSLPTAHHWRRSAPFTIFGDLLLLSNSNGTEDAPVGSSRAVARYGHSDLAGNVSEWTATESVDGKRFLLGGSWADPTYRFSDQDARAPFFRGNEVGFRCAIYPTTIDPELTKPIVAGRFDFASVTPVEDETFDFFRRLYDYEKVEVDGRIEETDESSPHWRRETVSFSPAYDGPRMLAHLFLPRNVEPPFQAVVWVPGSNARILTSVDQMLADPALFVARSGRALVLPAYFGMLERGGGGQPDRSDRGQRDGWVRRVNDLQRTIDYLESRSDIDSGNLGYVGLSLGAEYGPLFTAIEQRIAAIAFLAGGFDDLHMVQEPQEINPWHYAPRVQAPVLMINGENDYGLPVDTGQKPLFDLLGTPAELKRHVILEGGHLPADRNAMMRETLDWFDRHLGRVR